MGRSAADSVVNQYGQHWQVPNLFIVGASTFPQNPAPNPTPTVVAVAYRTADAVIDHYLNILRCLPSMNFSAVQRRRCGRA